MTDTIKETNTEKHYQELDLESSQNGRILRKLCLLQKVYRDKDHIPSGLYEFVLTNVQTNYCYFKLLLQ